MLFEMTSALSPVARVEALNAVAMARTREFADPAALASPAISPALTAGRSWPQMAATVDPAEARAWGEGARRPAGAEAGVDDGRASKSGASIPTLPGVAVLSSDRAWVLHPAGGRRVVAARASTSWTSAPFTSSGSRCPPSRAASHSNESSRSSPLKSDLPPARLMAAQGAGLSAHPALTS